MDVLDEAADLEWSRVVAQGDAVGGEAGELVDCGGQGEKVVFDG